MVEQAWLDEGDEIVSKSFMDLHINGNCIGKKELKKVIVKYFPPENLKWVNKDSRISLSKDYFESFLKDLGL